MSKAKQIADYINEGANISYYPKSRQETELESGQRWPEPESQFFCLRCPATDLSRCMSISDWTPIFLKTIEFFMLILITILEDSNFRTFAIAFAFVSIIADAIGNIRMQRKNRSDVMFAIIDLNNKTNADRRDAGLKKKESMLSTNNNLSFGGKLQSS